MKMSNDQMKEEIIKEVKKLYRIYFEYFKGYGINDTSYLDVLVEQINDLSIDPIPTLSQKQTLVLRKKLGIYDDGKIQKQTHIANSIGLSPEMVRTNLSRAYHKIYQNIKFYETKSKKGTDLLEANIKNMNYSQHTRNAIIRAGINTIGDLLNCTNDKLIGIRGLGKNGIEEIYNSIHSMGLHFIDEEQNKRIIELKEYKQLLEKTKQLEEYQKLLKQRNEINEQIEKLEEKLNIDNQKQKVKENTNS